MTSSHLVDARRKPNLSLIFSSSSGVRRLTIVNSTSSRHRSRFGRWELTVQEPAPITPRRSLATLAQGSYAAWSPGVKKGGATAPAHGALRSEPLESPRTGGRDVESRQGRAHPGQLSGTE